MRPKRCLHFEFFSMKKPPAKNPAPKLHQVSEKALMPTKKLFTVVWLSIKRWQDQMNAPRKVSPFWFFFNEKAYTAKYLAPKLHQVSDKASMPTKKLITVVWSSIKRRRDQMNWTFFSMKKSSAKELALKLYQVSEKALMHPKKLINVVWSSIKRWRDQMNAPQQVSPFWNLSQ